MNPRLLYQLFLKRHKERTRPLIEKGKTYKIYCPDHMEEVGKNLISIGKKDGITKYAVDPHHTIKMASECSDEGWVLTSSWDSDGSYRLLRVGRGEYDDGHIGRQWPDVIELRLGDILSDILKPKYELKPHDIPLSFCQVWPLVGAPPAGARIPPPP
jgi:hypothetical protein